MRKFKFLTVILSLMVFIGSFTACKPDTLQLNFMSFNIRTDASEDVGVKSWYNRKDAVVDFINNSGADVIGLQEVTLLQFINIDQSLKDDYEVLLPRESSSNPEGLAFIYDKTVFKLVSSEIYWLSETPDTQSKGWGESYYRAAFVLMLKHIKTGKTVKAINTHGPLNHTANENAYKLIAQRSLTDDYFTFLCGDFNARPDELGYVPIAEKLQDCRVTAKDSSNREDITFNSWGNESDQKLIDFCFVSKGENVEVLNYAVRNDTWGNDAWGDGHLLSDHYAVQTTVSVTL